MSKAAESSNGAKKYLGNFQKKKEVEANVVSTERRGPRRRPQYTDQLQVAAVTPAVNAQPVQVPQQQNIDQNQNRNRAQFDPIPMIYTDLYPVLVQKGLITTRPLLPRNTPPVGFRFDLHCVFHQGVVGHDLESCYPLKNRVQELVKENILIFKVAGPNVIDNPLPK